MPFQPTAKWLKKNIKSEQLHEHLTNEIINWKFNLPKGLRWGGHFERLVWVIKQALHKSMGIISLRWSKLTEAMLDAEINMKNRHLTYIEEDIQYPVLTPNSMILDRDTKMVEGNMMKDKEEDLGWQKRQSERCKDAAWRRWQRDYVTVLRERLNI